MAQDPYAFIFGYGSLVETKSRASTVASALYAQPAVALGIQRGWFDRVETAGYSPTYLGAYEDKSGNAACNGVIYPVTQQEYDAYVKRESGYKPTPVTAGMIMLDGTSGPPPSTKGVIYFASTKVQKADPKFPIVQSYVDVCLTGCLQIEAAYPLARTIQIKGGPVFRFSELFIESTSEWSPYWENDRLLPRRPFVHQPNANDIDTLLNNAPKTKGIYPSIQLAPGKWL
jgi:hypothetical protein